MEIKKGYKQTELGVIPEDWEVQSLGELFTFKNGLNKEKKFFGYGTPIVNYTDVYKKRGLYSNDLLGKVYVNKQEITNYEVFKNDVFFTRTSETTEEIGLTSVILDDIKDTVFSGFLLRARPKYEKLNLDYKRYCFSTLQIRKEITSLSSNTTRALINGKLLSKVKLVIPSSKAEQTSIANVLSDTDALITSLEKLIAKKRLIKQGAMQQLLTGKKRLPGFSGKWEVKKLEEVGEIDPDNLEAKTNPDYEFCYISLEDVDQGHLTGYSEMRFRFAPSRARRRIKLSDILISTVRPNLRSHFFVKNDLKNFICSTGFSVLRCYQNDYEPKYIFYHLFANNINSQIDTLLTGSNYPAINSSDIKKLLIPFPPAKTEQTAIAEVLSNMDTEIESLENKLAKYRLIKQGMMQELLTGKTRLI